MASLDDGKFALAFSSGLGVISAISQLLNAGDHVICMDDVYGGTNRYFSKIASKFCISVSFVDLTDPRTIDKEIKPNTKVSGKFGFCIEMWIFSLIIDLFVFLKLIWIENPTNPMMKVVDIRTISRYAKFKSRDVMVVVDNTFLTPYFQVNLFYILF